MQTFSMMLLMDIQTNKQRDTVDYITTFVEVIIGNNCRHCSGTDAIDNVQLYL